jgi:hypothetical protein
MQTVQRIEQGVKPISVLAMQVQNVVIITVQGQAVKSKLKK